MAFPEWQKESFPSLLIIGSIILLLIINMLLKNTKTRNLKLPPGPSKLPIIGNLHQLGKMPHLSLHHLAKKHGPIIFLQLGQVPTVVISSPTLAKEALKTNDLALSNRPELFSAKHLFYNCTDIAFSPYGAYWRHIRKICILELLSAKRVQSYSSVREQEVKNLVHRIAGSCPDFCNLSRMLGLYANSVLCRVAFGKDFTEGGEYDEYGFQKLLDEYQSLLGGFSIGDFFPSIELVHKVTGMESRLKKTAKAFDNVFNELIKDHLDTKDKRVHQDLVDVLLGIKETESVDIPLTMDNIKAVILDMFAAGTDTTFITLDWAMTELIMNPKVMEKAQAEVRSVVAARTFVSEDDLTNFPYMKAVIKETFRLHPAVPVLVPRESMENVTIDGYDIPAKTRVFINAWAIGRDPESWENPDSFQPERFMNSSIDFKGQDFELIPFGAGRRMCPATTFSTATVELALAQLLNSFDWGLPPGVESTDLDLSEAFGISMHKISPLIVVAKRCF